MSAQYGANTPADPLPTDAAGNITQSTDLVTAGFNRQFGCDDLHRLTALATWNAPLPDK